MKLRDSQPKHSQPPQELGNKGDWHHCNYLKKIFQIFRSYIRNILGKTFPKKKLWKKDYVL